MKLLLFTNPSLDEYNYITLKFGIFASLYRCLCLPSSSTLLEINENSIDEEIEDDDKLIGDNNDNNENVIRERHKLRYKKDLSSKFEISSDNLNHKVSLSYYTSESLPIQGITLQGILQFVERCGSIEKLENYQMYEIWDKFIIPLTDLETASNNPILPYKPLSNRLLLSSSSSSYCDYLHRDNTYDIKKVISTPNVYISYNSEVSFNKIFNTILDYFDKFEDGNFNAGLLKTEQERWGGINGNDEYDLENIPVLYMDLFSNNLNIDLIDRCNINKIDNTYKKKNCFDWCWSTYHIIKRCKYLVVVIEPFANIKLSNDVDYPSNDKLDTEYRRSNRLDGKVNIKNSGKHNKNNSINSSKNRSRNYLYKSRPQIAVEKSIYLQNLNKSNLNKNRAFSISLRTAWQIYSAYDTNSVFELLLSDRDKEKLFTEISKSHGKLYENLVSINCSLFSSKEYSNNSKPSSKSKSCSKSDNSDNSEEYNVYR